MQFEGAVEYHHRTLRQLLAMLLVYAGLTDENEQVRSPEGMRQRASEPFTLSRRIRDMVLRLLVPVESATRRLIVVLASQLPMAERRAAERIKAHEAASTANGVTPTLNPQGGGELAPDAPGSDRGNLDKAQSQVDSPPPCGEGLGVGVPLAEATVPASDQLPPRLPLFALTDTPKRFDWFYNPRPEDEAPWAGPGAERADPFERVDAQPIMRRVAALYLALNDLPRQAKRFRRWRAMRLKARAAGKRVSDTPLRTGEAPGQLAPSAPKRLRQEEHGALKELDWCARDALKRLDSS